MSEPRDAREGYVKPSRTIMEIVPKRDVFPRGSKPNGCTNVDFYFGECVHQHPPLDTTVPKQMCPH